jgi:hypothetical protein
VTVLDKLKARFDPRVVFPDEVAREAVREIERLLKMTEDYAAEINRRRGEMAVAREALTEAGIPQKVDGLTLTTSQRIKMLADKTIKGK